MAASPSPVNVHEHASRSYGSSPERRPGHVGTPQPSVRNGRKRLLSRAMTRTSTVLSPVFHVRGRGRDLFAAVQRLDLEGVVARRVADAYQPDTSGER